MTFINEYFEIRKSETAGQGAFAVCDIMAGTLLIAEKPIVRLTSNTEAYIKGEVDKLAAEDQAAFLALSNNHPKKGLYAGLASTNATPVDDTQTTGATVCLIVSRFNHSCSPNALYYWDAKQEKELIHALVPITKGAEINVCYAENYTAYRTIELKSQHNFTCACKTCSLPTKELAISNANRHELKQLQDATPMLLQTNPELALEACKRSLELVELEGLQYMKSSIYYDAFQTCAAWSDLQHAKAWAAKAEEAFTIMRGKNSEDVIKMRKLATKKGPLQHRLWGAMGRQTLS